MYTLRVRTAAAIHLQSTHLSRNWSTTRLVGSAASHFLTTHASTCPLARVLTASSSFAQAHHQLHTSTAAHNNPRGLYPRPSSAEVEQLAKSHNAKKKQRSSFKIHRTVGDRKREEAEKEARQFVREQEEAMEAEAEETAREAIAAMNGTTCSTQSKVIIGDIGEAMEVTPTMSESQVRGILAKRAALQKIHPLKMYITSPRSGEDRHRTIPRELQGRIDEILRFADYESGQNDVIQRKDYPLWHVANRSAIEFGVLARVFDEIVKRLPSLDPSSVLDYGAGTNMALLALLESLHKHGNKDYSGQLVRPIRDYRVIESNTGLAKYGTQLTQEDVQREHIEVNYRANLPTLPPADSHQSLEQSGVVVAPFSLSLLDHQTKRHKVLDVLWASVAPGGVLVLIEGGSIDAFQMIRESREYILNAHGMRNIAQRVKPNAAETAANIVAPCGSNGICPMGDLSLKQSCWHRSEVLTSSLPLRMPGRHLRTKDGITVETFSYIVIHKGPIRTTKADAERALLKWQPKEKDLTELGQQGWKGKAREESFALQERQNALQDQVPQVDENGNAIAVPILSDLAATTIRSPPLLDSNQPPSDFVTKRTNLIPVAHLLPSMVGPTAMFERQYSRIMRKPLKRGEHVILDICNENSELERRVVAKSFGIPYTLARMVNEGDLWPVPKRTRAPETQGEDGLTIGERRRAQLKERKEKRAAKLSEMDEEEATLARQELNAKKAAERAEREKMKEKQVQAKHDAEIVARGGTVPDREAEAAAKAKKAAKAAQPSPDEMIFIEEGELDEEGELQLAKFHVGTVPIQKPPPPVEPIKTEKPKKEKKAKKVAQELKSEETKSSDQATSSSTTSEQVISTNATEATASPITDTSEASNSTPSNLEADADSTAPVTDSSTSEPTPTSTSPSPVKPKSKSQPKPTVKKPLTSRQAASLLAQDKQFSSTGSVSRMPEWMASLMKQTKRAEGGGLEYTGTQNQKRRERYNEDDDDDEDDYEFEPDPTTVVDPKQVQRAIRGEDSAIADLTQIKLENAAKEKERREAEKKRRQERSAEILAKQKAKAEVKAKEIKKQLDREVEEAKQATEQGTNTTSAAAVISESTAPSTTVTASPLNSTTPPSPSNHDSAPRSSTPKPQPSTPKSSKPSSSQDSTPTPRPTRPVSASLQSSQKESKPSTLTTSTPTTSTPVTDSVDAPKPPKTHFFVQSSSPATTTTSDAPTTNETTPSFSSSSPTDSTGAFTDRPPRQPKWAKYRQIKNATPIPATPENTQAWPKDSKDAKRNLEVAYPPTHPDHERVMKEYGLLPEMSREGLKIFTPAQLSFFKREQLRRRKYVEEQRQNPPATSAPTTPTSTLPPHLAALKKSVEATPIGQRFMAHSERTREYRNQLQAAARERAVLKARRDREEKMIKKQSKPINVHHRVKKASGGGGMPIPHK